MSRVGTPTNVNIKNPLALKKVAEAVESGFGRNFSEAAENLILRGAEAGVITDQHPAPSIPVGDTRTGKSTTSAA